MQENDPNNFSARERGGLLFQKDECFISLNENSAHGHAMQLNRTSIYLFFREICYDARTTIINLCSDLTSDRLFLSTDACASIQSISLLDIWDNNFEMSTCTLQTGFYSWDNDERTECVHCLEKLYIKSNLWMICIPSYSMSNVLGSRNRIKK